MNDDGSVRVSPKRSLRSVFEEACATDKKLAFQGPDNLRPDSRYAVLEIASDHVVFQLVGEERLVIPFSGISALRVSNTQLTIRYG